ncbi:hypothetical protein B0H13DRAFT_1902995 [Mycena leptocephala]|nr:hypothetical protein B0H13DRAFT_1902995 [Mycena leptocephala]
MPSPVESGQEIMVPLFDAEIAGAPVHVNWQQNMSQRKADYYALTAKNIITGEQVPSFIAAEYYKSSMKANTSHITKVAELVEGHPPLRLGSPFQYSPRLQSEPYKRHYHARRQDPYTADSPLRSLRSTTEMLHRLNHKASLSPMDSGIVKDSSNGISPLGISVAELAGGFNHIALDCAPPVTPAETQEFSSRESTRTEVLTPRHLIALDCAPPVTPAETQEFSSRESTRTEADTTPSICPHGFGQAKPDTPMSPLDICPHGFMWAKVDPCLHGMRWGRIPETPPSNVCPHGFRRAKIESETRVEWHVSAFRSLSGLGFQGVDVARARERDNA